MTTKPSPTPRPRAVRLPSELRLESDFIVLSQTPVGTDDFEKRLARLECLLVEIRQFHAGHRPAPAPETAA